MQQTLEYISNKSKELLSTQIDSYRSLHQKAGTIIAVAALFAPLFLFLVEKAELWVRVSASLLAVPLIVGIILLILTLRAQKLNRGYDETNFVELLNQKLEDVHTFEIAYNKYSVENNDVILNKQNKKYNLGISFILTSIILSIGLLIVDTATMNKDSNNNKSNSIMAKDDKKTTSSDSGKKKIFTLPEVDPGKVKQLNEGVDSKKETRKGNK
jgi:hypothetical protein